MVPTIHYDYTTIIVYDSQKALHGYFVRSCDRNVDEVASVYWLTMDDLALEKEGFLLAKKKVSFWPHKTRHSAQEHCRLFSLTLLPHNADCNSQPETVESLISGCTQLAGTEYKARHDDVAKYIHWLLCGKYNMQRERHRWTDSVTENDFAKILWDFNISWTT